MTHSRLAAASIVDLEGAPQANAAELSRRNDARKAPKDFMDRSMRTSCL